MLSGIQVRASLFSVKLVMSVMELLLKISFVLIWAPASLEIQFKTNVKLVRINKGKAFHLVQKPRFEFKLAELFSATFRLDERMGGKGCSMYSLCPVKKI